MKGSKMKRILTALLLCSAIALWANVWNTDGSKLPRKRAIIPVPYNEADAEEKEAGFFFRVTDMRRAADHRFRFSGNELRKLVIPVTPGDYYTASLCILPLKVLTGKLEISVSDLKNGNSVIPAQNIRILEALEVNKRDLRMTTAPLVDPILRNLAAGEIVGLVFFADVSHNTPAGVYQGMISAKSDAGQVNLPLILRVMPFILPPLKESFGYYLPGHLSKPAIYPDPSYREGEPKTGSGRYAPPGLDDQEDLERLFRFYRTRRINSIALFHNYPVLKWENGKPTGSFDELSLFATSMKKAGLDGKLYAEFRHLTKWCNYIAKQKRREQGKQIPKDYFLPEVNTYFEPALRLLLAQAEQEQWPSMRIGTEEEVSNNAEKKAGYDTFINTLKKVCPDKAALIDNDIGYDRPSAVDRGHRDKLIHRQYNSWTEKGLADAETDGAEIWSYNYDHGRPATGLLQVRLNSKGHHQWADQFDIGGKYFWRNSIVTEQGVITSLSIEFFHNGRLDLAAMRLLQSIAEKCGTEEKKKAEQLITELVADVPITGNAFRSWQQVITDHDLNLRRWKVFSEIERLQAGLNGRTPVQTQVNHSEIQTSLRYLKRESPAAAKVSDTIKALFSPRKLKFFDDENRKFFGRGTGPLGYIASQENRLRAICSSEDEFRRQYAPSYGEGFLCYTQEGLAFSLYTNHLRPKGACRYKRQNDDPNLWMDDVFELFFHPSSGQDISRLVINSAGSTTFFRNGKIIPSAGISRASRSPINNSGGTRLEGLIPWHYFGLREMPVKGEIWNFNLGREFHTFNQTCSWGKVQNRFDEQNHWGKLIFSGEVPLKKLQQLNPLLLYPGKNQITGQVTPELNQKLFITLKNADEKLIGKTEVKNNNRFRLPVHIGTDNVGKSCQLDLCSNTTVVESVQLPVAALHSTVMTKSFEYRCIQGDMFHLTADIRLPAGSEAVLLAGILENAKGEKISLTPKPLDHAGVIEFSMNTANLKMGEWKLYLWVDQLDGKTAEPTVVFELLPPVLPNHLQ